MAGHAWRELTCDAVAVRRPAQARGRLPREAAGRSSDETRGRAGALWRIAGQNRRAMAFAKTRNKILSQLGLAELMQHSTGRKMWRSCEGASIVIVAPVGLMLGGKTPMNTGLASAAIHGANDQDRIWLAAEVRHPTCGQQRTQDHRGKREMNCQMTQVAGHISSVGNLMRGHAGCQCAVLAQPPAHLAIIRYLSLCHGSGSRWNLHIQAK
jgi:hypothetical protein